MELINKKFDFIKVANTKEVLTNFYYERFKKDIKVLDVSDKKDFIGFVFELDNVVDNVIFTKDEIIKFAIKNKIRHLNPDIADQYLDDRCTELVSIIKSIV